MVGSVLRAVRTGREAVRGGAVGLCFGCPAPSSRFGAGPRITGSTRAPGGRRAIIRLGRRRRMTGSPSYDAIAERYRESKRLSFRQFIERHTLMTLVGDLRGRTVLDLACGEGTYARQFKRVGAAEVTGVDISEAMIALAVAEERAAPLGCRYVCRDAAVFTPEAPVDVVTAVYLFNHGRTRDAIERFGRACFRAMRPDGLLVGIKRQRAETIPAGLGVARQVRDGAHLHVSPAGRRADPLPDDQRRRAVVRVRRLLLGAVDLRGGHARPVPARRSLLGRLLVGSAHHRVQRKSGTGVTALRGHSPGRRASAALCPGRSRAAGGRDWVDSGVSGGSGARENAIQGHAGTTARWAAPNGSTCAGTGEGARLGCGGRKLASGKSFPTPTGRQAWFKAS